MRSFMLVGLLFCSLMTHAQVFVDIDATGANDGSSWADAYNTLDSALSQSTLHDQIWVAEGTYVPIDSFNGLLPLYILAEDRQLYGGFAGTETLLSERDPALHPTILSGDVEGDDIAGDLQSNRSDNLETIFIADTGITQATVIDGFTFQGGHAAGPLNFFGGGLGSAGSPRVQNCTFVDNYAAGSGGAVYVTFETAAGIVFDDCTFTGNYAEYGAGLSIDGVTSPLDTPQIINCVFSQNEANDFGGGIDLYNSEAIVIGCRFSENQAPNNIGGGISIIQFQTGAVAIEGCVFAGNAATIGGGIYFQGSSAFTTLDIAHSSFSANTSSIMGAGVFAYSPRADGRVQIIGCEFSGNTSDIRGGGLYYEAEDTRDTLVVDSCLFTGNEAFATSGDGGGGLMLFYDPDGSAPVSRISNTTFTDNSAFLGGGLYANQLCEAVDIQLENCAFTENLANFGGGMHTRFRDDLGRLTIERCAFARNQAQHTGGGLRLLHSASSGPTLSRISNCSFEDNISNETAGAMGVSFQGFNGFTEVDSCTFEGNQAEGVGGLFATSSSLFSSLTIHQSSFSDHAGFQSGAVGLETLAGGELAAQVSHSDFFRNQGTYGAGGLGIFANEGALLATLEVSDCAFTENRMNVHGGPSYGAGIGIGTAVGTFEAQVERCTFTNNHNPNGAGAIAFVNFPTASADSGALIEVHNSLFTQHDSSLAVLQLTHESDNVPPLMQVTLNNLTLADNEVPAIQSLDNIPLSLRNNILYSPSQMDMEIGDHSLVVSEGGNLISDASANDILTAADTSEVDPLFTGIMPHPYQLQDNSPAVNLGILYTVFDSTITDLLGNDRVQGTTIDAGAFESDFTILLHTHIIEQTGLTLYPNPVKDRAHISLENDWRGTLTVRLFSAAGQQVFQDQFTKTQQEGQWTLSGLSIPNGIYQLVISDGQRAAYCSLMKR